MKRTTKIMIFIVVFYMLGSVANAASNMNGKNKIIVTRARKTICRAYYGEYVSAMRSAEAALNMMSNGIPIQSQFSYSESMRRANTARSNMVRMGCGM